MLKERCGFCTECRTQGQVPSKEYSDVMTNALKYPKYMIEYLKKHEEKIGETAYKKALKAAEELDSLMSVSGKMLSVISYIFERVEEVTPLALQKLLYFIQGLYMIRCGEPMYEEDCVAWVHGPVYEAVYEMFKTFKYNPIKEIIDLVINSFGMYSGKTLERITHNEGPWKQAREGYLPMEPSNVIIEKETIREYFQGISEKYDITNEDGIRKYIYEQLRRGDIY